MEPIMAIKVNGRIANAPLVQDILTRYGCNIKTRIGFHEATKDNCAMDGVLILQLLGSQNEVDSMYEELKKLEGVIPKMIEF